LDWPASLDVILNNAAKHGHVSVFQWLLEHKMMPLDAGGDALYDCTQRLIRKGHLGVLQWMHAMLNMRLSVKLYSSLSVYNHVQALDWVLSQGACKLRRTNDPHCTYYDYTPAAQAAACGSLGALQCLKRHGYAWDKETCKYASLEGHLNVLEWAVSNLAEWDPDECAAFAAQREHQHIVAWITAHH
jgi:hypothetical protein